MIAVCLLIITYLLGGVMWTIIALAVSLLLLLFVDSE